MNIRNVLERLRKIYNSNSEDFTKCELMENILRAYQRSIEDRIMKKFHNGFWDSSIHTVNTRSIIRKKLNAIADLINMQIEGLLDNYYIT